MAVKIDKTKSFEESLARLEEIVEAMESGETNLDTLVSQFEEGQALIKFCTDKLDEVEKKIEKLSKNREGKLEMTPYEAANPGKEKPVTGEGA